MRHTPLIDRRHLDFALYELLDVPALCAYPRFSEHSRETFEAVTELAHKVALETFLPHNRKADLHEPEMVDGKVVLIPEIEAGVQSFIDAGFMAILADVEDGGMQLPFVICAVCDGLFASANLGTSAYPMLARAAANLLAAHGSEAQKRRWMRPIIEGRFFGTMCLSEPQAGSSLADIKTTATLQPDGSYRLHGAKMWISAGDHELGENIVHLVLARIEGAPAGVRGISLFIVPRWRQNADGSRGERNDVRLAGLNHKMGQRGSVNTFLKFGESDDCHAELIGEPHRGLAYMFHMMNEERIGVGFGAIQQGYTGYLYSLQYARERRPGRHPDQKDPAAAPLPIIEHADVRRMLLAQRSYVEGSHLLGLLASTLVDQAHSPDTKVRDDSHALLELLTPIVKSWCSDWCLKANELAVQVLGGYGYTREYPVEQCYRDNRINPIHEGTNGIQALDLLGRKAMQDNGAGLRLLFARIEACCADAAAFPELASLATELRAAMQQVATTTRSAGQQMAAGEVRAVLANAQYYMNALGHVCIGWIWLWQAVVAQRALPTASHDRDFYLGKLQTCRWFFAVELPQVAHWTQLVSSAEPSACAMQDAWF